MTKRGGIFTGLAAISLLVGAHLAALAIQPGTSGTEKRFQQQGLRSGVLIQKDNTATATAGAATLNSAGSGIVTSESLSTAAGSDYTLTLTNDMIAAADVVLPTVQNGTNTGGKPMVSTSTPAAGSVVIVVSNICQTGGLGICTTAFNGTLKIGFVVVKQSANGSD